MVVKGRRAEQVILLLLLLDRLILGHVAARAFLDHLAIGVCLRQQSEVEVNVRNDRVQAIAISADRLRCSLYERQSEHMNTNQNT